MIWLFDSHSLAATWPVTSAYDSGVGSLRTALDSAAPGDRIEIFAKGPLRLASPLTIDKQVEISAIGRDPFVLSSESTNYLLWNRAAAVLINLEFAESRVTNGTIVTNSADLTMVDCSFRQNQSVKSSGGILASRGTLKLTNCAFILNVVSGKDAGAFSNAPETFGGAISVIGGQCFVDQSRFISNRLIGSNPNFWGFGITHAGSALGAAMYATNAVLRIERSDFVANRAEGGIRDGDAMGGALYLDFSSAHLASTVFSNNLALGASGPGIGGAAHGGAIVSTNSRLTLVSSRISDNSAFAGVAARYSSAGGLFHWAGDFICRDSTITGNSADSAADVVGAVQSEGGNRIGNPGGAIGFRQPSDQVPSLDFFRFAPRFSDTSLLDVHPVGILETPNGPWILGVYYLNTAHLRAIAPNGERFELAAVHTGGLEYLRGETVGEEVIFYFNGDSIIPQGTTNRFGYRQTVRFKKEGAKFTAAQFDPFLQKWRESGQNRLAIRLPQDGSVLLDVTRGNKQSTTTFPASYWYDAAIDESGNWLISGPSSTPWQFPGADTIISGEAMLKVGPLDQLEWVKSAPANSSYQKIQVSKHGILVFRVTNIENRRAEIWLELMDQNGEIYRSRNLLTVNASDAKIPVVTRGPQGEIYLMSPVPITGFPFAEVAFPRFLGNSFAHQDPKDVFIFGLSAELKVNWATRIYGAHMHFSRSVLQADADRLTIWGGGSSFAGLTFGEDLHVRPPIQGSVPSVGFLAKISLPAHRLNFRFTPNQIAISWPEAYRFELQQSFAPTGPWSPASGNVDIENVISTFTATADSPAKAFRLARPSLE